MNEQTKKAEMKLRKAAAQRAICRRHAGEVDAEYVRLCVKDGLMDPVPVREGPGWKQWGELGPGVGTGKPVDTKYVRNLAHEIKMGRSFPDQERELIVQAEEMSLQLDRIEDLCKTVDRDPTLRGLTDSTYVRAARNGTWKGGTGG